MSSYKRHLELGDEYISKRTAYRYKQVGQVRDNDEVDNSNTLFEQLNNADIDHQYHELNAEDEIISMDAFDDYLRSTLFNEILDKESQTEEYSKTLDDLMNISSDFLKPVSVQVSKSKGELLLMVLKYSVVNSLSVTAMTNLFKLINNIFEFPILPNSQYLIDNLLNPKDNVEFHATCHNCSAYIGKFGEIDSVKNCRICQVEVDLKNTSNTSFFVLLDPSSQIKDLIHTYQDHYDYVVKKRVHKTDYLEDIYDGVEYRKFVQSLSGQDKYNYISTIFNTDGATKFKCSQYSIWPLYLMVNELPKQERMQKVITCGLWFNKIKPDMNIFLDTFVDVINRVTKQGISCNIKGEERILHLYIVSCCVDSVARAPIQGIKQFNGNYGCSWCLHPGEWCAEYSSLKYTLLKDPIILRNHKNTIDNMLIATPNHPVNGIKYPSPLINLVNFNIISGFVPDYLHCCLEGVAKQFTEYHLSSMNNDDIAEIDRKILNLAVPIQITRLSRSISSRKEWKAREWENYVLYYSAPVLSEHLSKDHLYHWLLFVESLYILLQDNINTTELNKANVMLHEFVSKTEMYFGKQAMTFNTHQLLHISKSVQDWGPLWCQSTFSFESANHDLLKAIKCSKGVTSQILRFININHTVNLMQENIYPYVDDLVKMYCEDVLYSRVKNYCKINNTTYVGRGDDVDDALVVNLNLSKDSAKIYFKIIQNGCLYESSIKTKKRSNNSFVQLRNGKYARLYSFIVDQKTAQEFTVCNILKIRNCFSQRCDYLKVIEKIEEENSVINTNEIRSICVNMKILDKTYICTLPNLLHY